MYISKGRVELYSVVEKTMTLAKEYGYIIRNKWQTSLQQNLYRLAT
ncbi:MAG: hypothetical protein QXU32_09385 [Nitrososphaerales archaeon]